MTTVDPVSRRPRTSPHSGSASSVIDAATRLLSETAHDLRSPLTTIRESIRLVHDGEFGQINPEQREYLSAALEQCDCVDQLVGEMVQLDRLKSGSPQVHRQSVSVVTVRDAVNETLRPWVIPRGIQILWDGADDPNLLVFADATMLRRLIVNLVTNAIRATPDDEAILIRLERTRSGDTVRWSVIDQGVGIGAPDLHAIAEQRVSFSGSEGLGLIICRQLAALQFSALHIRSRLHAGTEVAFETPTAGASSVAECWARWRVAYRQARDRPRPSGLKPAEADWPSTRACDGLRLDRPAVAEASDFAGGPDQGDGSGSATGRRPANSEATRHRIDRPAVTVQLEHEAVFPRVEQQAVAGTVTVGATLPVSTADQFDSLLQSQQRLFDLVYRVDTRTWVWIFDTDHDAVSTRIEAITEWAQREIQNVRLTWSQPRVVPIDDCRTVRRISDLLVRQSLSASTVSTAGSQDEVRLGTTPLEQSPVASSRLDAEMSRLIARFSQQASVLQQQAVNLRPGLASEAEAGE